MLGEHGSTDIQETWLAILLRKMLSEAPGAKPYYRLSGFTATLNLQVLIPNQCSASLVQYLLTLKEALKELDRLETS